MSFQIDPDLQEKLARFEQVKVQLQMVLNQKGEMEARKREADDACQALGSRKEGDVYHRVGDIMIKVEDVDSLLKDLKDDLETLQVRIGSMENQERSLKTMYEKMGKEINEALKGYQ
ncbi:MAG: prefoldin subunit beta [Candidatus Thermoplasmatota archaeon]|nr:prefoldin subunit beta [Candidatus Thermoplasmatota archaeon]